MDTVVYTHVLHRIYQLDQTFGFLIFKAKFRNQAMLVNETLIELFDTEVGFKRSFCLTV